MDTERIYLSSEPNRRLYEKLQAEMDEYTAELRTKPPDEILENAYDYATRQDILLVLESYDLTDRQCDALLKSKHPMRDILAKWERCERPYMNTLRETVESTANDVLRKELKERLRQEREAR